MSESKVCYSKFLVEDGLSGTFVIVSHKELDGLIGRLMQMCDLIGDVEQRTALKSTIKQLCREWLDNEYADAGYDRWTGIKEGAKFIDAQQESVQQEFQKD